MDFIAMFKMIVTFDFAQRVRPNVVINRGPAVYLLTPIYMHGNLPFVTLPKSDYLVRVNSN